ncbi:hypothetical protein ACFVTX_18140 [Agromyces sp. NPDC058136]|uniref:hypothetical protein n=1 Tax=Agromyces sp. NPDC058136 TaxID=3346354 RepID=UPI0036DE0CF4
MSKWTIVWGTLLSVVFLVGGYLLIKGAKLDGDLITALFTALAAVAAFASALAALHSARQSSATAHHALLALSLTSKPDVEVALNFHDRGLQLNILNYAPHPIARAVVRWKLRGGIQGSRVLGALPYSPPAGLTIGRPGNGYEPIELAPNPGNVAGVDEIEIDYWGINSTIGWRRTQTFTWTPIDDSRTDVYLPLEAGHIVETELR